jgi:hypothetical protein
MPHAMHPLGILSPVNTAKQLLHTQPPCECTHCKLTWVVQWHHLRLPQRVDQPQVALPGAQQQHRPCRARAGPRQRGISAAAVLPQTAGGCGAGEASQLHKLQCSSSASSSNGFLVTGNK